MSSTDTIVGYRHEALLYRGPEEFLARTVPFVRDGIALGHAVMVAVATPRLDGVRAALGPDADEVLLVDMAELGHNPARIIPAWQDFVARSAAAGRPARGIGEPIWAGRRAAEILESQLHEALLNVAISPDTPLWLLCPYDVDALGPDLIGEASHSHPALVEDGEYRGSRSYGGAQYASSIFGRPLPEPTGGTTRLAFGEKDLRDVRRAVADHATGAGLGPSRAAELALVMTEMATNSVRHGGGRGTLRLWCDDDSVVAEVADSGQLHDLLVGRRRPDVHSPGGRGMWLVHQLTDLVQIRSSSAGTAVRVLAHR